MTNVTDAIIVILSRIGGGVKSESILFQKERKDHAKGSKDLHNRVEAGGGATG
jgi:hypothetical protein